MDKLNLSWDDIDTRADVVALEIGKSPRVITLWGVPRGGIYAVQAVSKALWRINQPNRILSSPQAEFFIDDIIDSGATELTCLEESEDEDVGFYALVDYQDRDKEMKGTWISFPWERMINEDGPTENIRRLLEYIGEDPAREGLIETPGRVIKSYEKLFGGYKQNPKEIIKTFKDNCDEMVLVKDIEFYSTCEHHMLPFFGKAHIAYIPDGKVIGVSKLVRLLEIYTRRLQIQERICQQVTNALQEFLNPIGAACVLEAQHFCMTARGVEKQNSIMVTSSLDGAFKTKLEARNEFFQLIGK